MTMNNKGFTYIEVICSSVIVLITFSVFLMGFSSSIVVSNQSYDTNQGAMLGYELMTLINSNKDVFRNATTFEDILQSLYGDLSDRLELDKFDYHLALLDNTGNPKRILSTQPDISNSEIRELFDNIDIELNFQVEPVGAKLYEAFDNSDYILLGVEAKNYEGGAVYFGYF